MIVLVGLDNTLCDSKWRSPVIELEGWEAYHAKLIEDKPFPVIRDLITRLKTNGDKVIGITARPDRWRISTYGWLMRHKVPIDTLLMRADDDFRAAPAVKIDLYSKSCASKRADLLIDDRDDVIAAFRSIGVCCLQFAR